MKTRRELLNEAAKMLLESGASDARLDAEWLLSSATGLGRMQLLSDLEAPVPVDQMERFEVIIGHRAIGEPLQYVLGETDFMGHTFFVDARVLIPRAGTETLCEEAIRRAQPECRVLDIGTGSGALAISIALACPQAQVTAVDISNEALWVARENQHALGTSVTWVQSDLFDALPGRSFDLIVSNPPYIPAGDLPGLQREVRFEPALALDGGIDGLDFYRRIVAALPAHLVRGGSLLFEVGDGQAADVAAMMAPQFESIQILRDLAGLERVVAGDGYAG